MSVQRHQTARSRYTGLLSLAGALGVITLLAVSIGYFSCELHKILYREHVPVFDSMAYTNTLALIMQTSHNQGLLDALSLALHKTTVFLPWLIAAVIGKFIPASRFIGIWIQTGILTLFLYSLFYYFYRVRNLSCSLSVMLLLPFVGFSGLYASHGGLSDFRMDLSLFLWFSISVTWYLIASRTDRLFDYCIFGMSCGLACLNRATAPVYLGISLLPPIIWEMFRSKKRSRMLKHLCCAGASALIMCGWFYAVRFQHLHRYYFIWNVDSTACLPLAAASRHFFFAFRFLGKPLLILMLFWNIVLLPYFFSTPEKLWYYVSHVDVKVLYIGLAPAAFLMITGAGLNPYVAMPSAFGILLFLCLPCTVMFTKEDFLLFKQQFFMASVGILIFVMAQGLISHANAPVGSMKALRQIVDLMKADARSRKDTEISYSTTYVKWGVNASIRNILLYEYQGQYRAKDVVVDEFSFSSPVKGLNTDSPAGWKSVSGESDMEKMNTLLLDANAQLDYIILPTQETARHLENAMKHVKINEFATELRKQFLASGNWIPISGVITVDQDEQVMVYRNQGKG
ncbi:hypothetical protein CSB45_07135 [candidate division KSB3 bacterium]|uniref:Glycosyltransferase RgtA/B/C/D-like domain-containing protein n=1 Tax=candidate division KSB3 bacterium TaxID=2044937 RepID=A0A2G6E6S0_9BACT|nr:MAG: hypothetical protein CSB45_07135 [candidate division KSB3 bacterium]